MTQTSFSRVALLGVGGGIGGLLSFLLLDPVLRREELHGRAAGSLGDALTDLLLHAVWFGVAIGVAVGVCLVLADEVRSGSIRRALLRGALAVGIGALCGAAGGIGGQMAFSLLHGANLVVGRSIGWALAGAAAGVCPGATASSGRRIVQGAIGGAVGGGLGGFLFDALAALSNTGSLSRAVGLVLLGAGIGLAVALVEETAKEHWLSVLSGAREGRGYILAKPQVTIGRDELADVPCFGDASVQRLHATLVVSGETVRLVAAPGAAVTINSQQAGEAFLRDGDLLGIGKHRLRFHSRRGAGLAASQPREVAPGMGIPAGGAAPAAPGNWYDALGAPPGGLGPGEGFAAPGAPGPDGAAPGTPSPPPGAMPAAGGQGALPPPPGLGGAAGAWPGAGRGRPEGAGDAGPAACRLEVLSGPHAGETFALGAAPLVIGREAGCAVALTRDPMASRQHARLTWDGARWRIEDLGSTNGLYVNGRRVTEQLVSPGDRLGVGGCVLQMKG